VTPSRAQTVRVLAEPAPGAARVAARGPRSDERGVRPGWLGARSVRRVALWEASLCVLAFLTGCASPSFNSPAPLPAGIEASRAAAGGEQVEFPSGTLRLHGLLWRPVGGGPFPAVLFNHGSGGRTSAETAGMPMTEAAARLAPLFTRRGYAFFYPFRRGQGASADAAPFLQDVLAHEEQAHGTEARRALQDTLLETEQLDDVLAALAFLRRAPGIDAGRLVLAGHSFGGQLTLLAAARASAVRAAVTFGAAATSWGRSAEVRRALRDAVNRVPCPLMLVQWRNDFSTDATTELAREEVRGGPRRIAVLYPPIGSTHEEGHNGLYLDAGRWEPEVFRFLESAVPR